MLDYGFICIVGAWTGHFRVTWRVGSSTYGIRLVVLSGRWLVLTWTRSEWPVLVNKLHPTRIWINLVSDYSVLYLALRRLILTWAWNFWSNFVLGPASDWKSLGSVSKLVAFIVLSRSWFDEIFFWNYLGSGSLRHLKLSQSLIFSQMVYRFISAWTRNSIILHVLGLSCKNKWPWSLSYLIMISVVSWTWKLSCLLRDNFLSSSVAHLVSNLSILDYTYIRIVVARAGRVISLCFFWSSPNTHTLGVFTKSLWWIILTRSRLVEHLLCNYLTSLTLWNFVGNYSISDNVRICLVSARPWSFRSNCIIRLTPYLKWLSIFAELISWGILTRSRKFLDLLLN